MLGKSPLFLDVELEDVPCRIVFNGFGDTYKWGYHVDRNIEYKKYRKELLEKYRHCVYCGSTEKLQIDHIRPITRGGKDNISNLAVACKRCNQKKYTKTLKELNVNFFLLFK